ncbi:cytochrome P450 [Corynascus novoguineensis]|uniref:Cytochrome P450 n=1 Tax=Corynascus novoguineensis TaxID=1126955 RepID=A0AAN7D1F7_9PEZI|nr:cytochrome P450 [Corynascus novoguineensis]
MALLKAYTPIPVLTLASAGSLYITRKSDQPAWPTMPTLTLIIILSYWMIWRGWLYPTYFSELRHVPTVPGFPLWGHIIPVISEECGIPQRRWHRQHGPIIRYFFPLGCERLSVADDKGIRHLTVKNAYNYPKPLRAKLWMVRILGEGVLLAEGPEHANQRKTLNPGFSISAIRSFTPVFWEKALLMADLQRRELDMTGEPSISFEILEWLNRCTLDIIGVAGFGYEIDSLRDATLPIRRAYRLVFNFDLTSRILHGVQAFFPASKHIPAQMNRDMEEARDIIMTEATKIITEKLEEAENAANAKDVLALIAQENMKLKQKGEPGLSFETMRDQIMTFLAAGHDTTATGVTWTIHLLSIHPEMQTRLRNEIREHMPFLFDPDFTYDRSMTLTDPDRLPYLDNVCRESLRYIPPIPMTVRESVADDVINGYKVPARTIVYILANAINRMEWFWGNDANTFNPDRWDNLPETAVPNAFMTFLQGPRGCLGRKFAEVEMKIMLCVMLSRFEFRRDESTPDPEEWKMWRLVLRPRDGVTVVAKPIIYPSNKPHVDKSVSEGKGFYYNNPSGTPPNTPVYSVVDTPEDSPVNTPPESPIDTTSGTPVGTPSESPVNSPPEAPVSVLPERHVEPPVDTPQGDAQERNHRDFLVRRGSRLLANIRPAMVDQNEGLAWLAGRRPHY